MKSICAWFKLLSFLDSRMKVHRTGRAHRFWFKWQLSWMGRSWLQGWVAKSGLGGKWECHGQWQLLSQAGGMYSWDCEATHVYLTGCVSVWACEHECIFVSVYECMCVSMCEYVCVSLCKCMCVYYVSDDAISPKLFLDLLVELHLVKFSSLHLVYRYYILISLYSKLKIL